MRRFPFGLNTSRVLATFTHRPTNLTIIRPRCPKYKRVRNAVLNACTRSLLTLFLAFQSVMIWRVFPTGYGGTEPAFFNREKKESTYNPPPGLTAQEIFEIPGAKRYLRSIRAIEALIEESKLGSLDVITENLPGTRIVDADTAESKML